MYVSQQGTSAERAKQIRGIRRCRDTRSRTDASNASILDITAPAQPGILFGSDP
jgi:hypothetical protein